MKQLSLISPHTKKKFYSMAINKNNDEVILIDYWASPFAARCRIALLEKGVKYEVKEETGLLSNKSELLLTTNPIYKKLPVLIHNGKAVNESTIIVQYIDEFWSDQAPILPKDAYARAHARFWADFIDKKLFDCGSKIWKLEGEGRKAAKDEFISILTHLEGELGDKNFFQGDEFGFVDISLVAFAPWFSVYESHGNFSVEKEFPKLDAWRKRCLERETVTKSLPDMGEVHEFVCTELKRYFGVV